MLSQLLEMNQFFWLKPAVPPVCTKRTVLKVKVNGIICYVDIFFLMFPTYTGGVEEGRDGTWTLSQEQLQSITFPKLNLRVFYQDRDQCPRKGRLAELPSPVRNCK